MFFHVLTKMHLDVQHFLGGCALFLLISGCCRALGSGSCWSLSWEWYGSLFLDSQPGAKLTMCKTLMSTNWYTQIEPTQMQEHMLLITMKQNLDIGHQWLDDSLPHIFQVYLPKNPEYVPDTEHPLPHCANIQTPNAKLNSYVDALRQCITLPSNNTDKNTTPTCPPPHWALYRVPHNIIVLYTQAAQTNSTTNTPAQKKHFSMLIAGSYLATNHRQTIFITYMESRAMHNQL